MHSALLAILKLSMHTPFFRLHSVRGTAISLAVIALAGCAPTTHPAATTVPAPPKAEITAIKLSDIPYAKLSMDSKVELLTQQVADVTGDGKLDDVAVVGHRVEPNALFHDHIWVIAHTSEGKWLTPTNVDFSGYTGKLQFGDINGDHIADVLATSESGGSGNTLDAVAVSFASANPKTLFASSESLNVDVSGRFEDHFVSHIITKPGNQSFTISLDKYRDSFIVEKVYSKNGKVLEKIEPWTAGIPIMDLKDVDSDGTSEIVTQTPVCGIAHVNILGLLETPWKFNHGKFEPLKMTYTEQ